MRQGASLMKHPIGKSLCAGLLLIVFLVPAVNAGVGTSPSNHWSFKFDDQGIWRAQGEHISFSWSLKPFEVYDVMVDGHLLASEISFPVDADAYMTEGANFKVTMGNTVLFQMHDSPSVETTMNCASPRDPALPPGPCDVEFPEGSVFEVYERGKVTQYHIEGAVDESGFEPCIKVSTQGESSLEGTTIMFVGGLNFRAPPGLAMQYSAIEG